MINNYQVFFLGACFLSAEITFGKFSAETERACKSLQCHRVTVVAAGTSFYKNFDGSWEDHQCTHVTVVAEHGSAAVPQFVLGHCYE